MKENFPVQKIESTIEKSEGRALLHELEATGKFVFHGSPRGAIEELELRQPHDYSGGKMEPHGEPCVAASPYADIAIFRAVVQHDWTGFGSNGRTLEFRASQKALDHAKTATGYVYVLPKTDFSPYGGKEEESMDWRAKSAQKPIQIVKVTFEDVPEGIQLIEKP